METVFGQALALWLEKWDERRPLESDTTGLKMSRGTFTFTLKAEGLQTIGKPMQEHSGRKTAQELGLLFPC